MCARMHCSSAYNILFYSLFFGSSREPSFDEILCVFFFCFSCVSFFSALVSNIIIENGQRSRWSCCRMWQKPFSYLKSLLVSHGTHVRWARAHAISRHLLAKLTLVPHMALATQPSYGRFDGVAMNFNGFVGIFSWRVCVCVCSAGVPGVGCLVRSVHFASVCMFFSRCTFHSN